MDPRGRFDPKKDFKMRSKKKKVHNRLITLSLLSVNMTRMRQGLAAKYQPSKKSISGLREKSEGTESLPVS